MLEDLIQKPFDFRGCAAGVHRNLPPQTDVLRYTTLKLTTPLDRFELDYVQSAPTSGF